MKRIELSGSIFSSRGEGKKFLELPWVKMQINQKLGFNPYPGTLNVMLSKESVKRKKLLEKVHSMKICPSGNYCSGTLIKALICKLDCAIVVPEIPAYPREILEIIAPVNLREQLKLKDGDEVTVKIVL